MDGLLAGKVALVSGVGPGMGRDVAMLFAEHGADVVLGARTLERCEALADEVRALGRRALPLRLDITDRASCDAAVAATVTEFGGLDVLVNNAFSDGDFTRFEHATLADWRSTMDTNLFGTLELTQAAVPALTARGESRVIMVNSMSAVRIRARFGAYTASKAALAAATRSLAAELGRHGIRVNGVHPGYIWGPSVEAWFRHQADAAGITFDEQYASVAGETALGYLPHSSEIAGAVLFLASDLAKPITGQALHVNCGHWYP